MINRVIRVLVANRPKLMRETLLATLSDQPWIEVVGEVASDAQIPGRVDSKRSVYLRPETSPDLLVITVDEPGKRPTLCDSLLRQHPDLHIIAVAPHQNYSVCYRASVDIRSDDIESSEQGFLNAVRRVAEDAGVQRQA